MSGPDVQAALSFREFFYHALLNRKPALVIAAGVFTLALIVAALLPPSYRSVAVLTVLPAPEYTVRAAAGSHEVNASALAMDQIMKTETEILASDDLHQATIAKVGPALLYPDVYAPPARGRFRRWLHAAAGALLSPWRVAHPDEDAARTEQGVARFHADLAVLPAKDANVITVTFDSRSNVRAAAALNALLALYAARRSQLYDDPQLEVVRREAEAGGRAVALADDRLAAFKHAHAISDYEAERDMLLHRRSQAEEAAQDAASRAGEHTARLESLTRQLNLEQPTIGVFSEQDADARLLAANAGLDGVQARLATAREKYRDTSRMVIGLRSELTAHQAERSRLMHDSTRSVVRQGRNPAIDPLRLDRAREAAELAASRVRLQAEQGEASRLSAVISARNLDEVAMAALQRQRGSADDDFRAASRILAERHLSEAEDARRLANVRVIQPASVPQTPRSTPMLVIAAGALFAGFSAFAWIVAAFLRHPVFLTGEGLASACSLPVLAVFPRLPVHDAGRLWHGIRASAEA